jgi:GT2 family glycosyltransferase
MTPALSIILVSYNSRADLACCLPTIFSQTYSDYELIVVDNHGRDGVAEFVQARYPAIRLVKNPVNSGYAGGNNVGIKQALGQWTLLLNPDTELRPTALAQLMNTARAHNDAFVTSKLLNPDGITINACGNQMHYTGITTCRGLNEPATSYQGLQPIPLLSGAAFVAPTAALRQLSGFDESYFMYFEDTDLSLRARLAGYTLLCDTNAEIIHHYRLGMTAHKFYYLERNRWVTFLKIFSRKTLLTLAPALFFTELVTGVFALRNWSFVRSRFRVYAFLWQQRQHIRAARKPVQTTRQRSDRELLKDSSDTLPVGQLASSGLVATMNRLLTKVYQLLRPAGLT